MELSPSEFLLDNIEGDFGYFAAVEDIEELLFQTECLASRRSVLLSPPGITRRVPEPQAAVR